MAGSASMILVLAAGILFIPNLRAQSAGENIENRFLFVFDTSSEMKTRLPMMQKTLNAMLATGIRGGLHSGDSIGVWTFGQDLRTGDFPLQLWDPEHAVTIAADINKFIGRQRYSKETKFAVLEPWLDEVIQSSPRLTVLIFCDGETPIDITPFDAGINHVFQLNQAEQKKARQPFIIVLQSQLGSYVFGAVCLPPETVVLPAFPPWPSAEPKSAAPAPVPPLIIVGTKAGTNPRSIVPPLVIVGTHVGTNALPRETSPPQVLVKSNVAAVPTISRDAMNPVATTNIVFQTNMVTSENSKSDGKGLLAVGAAFLIMAGALLIFMIRRARKSNRGSLITSSMNRRK